MTPARMPRRTKIVTTLGPATDDARVLQELFKAGRYKKADVLMRQLLREDPLNTDYLFWTGRCSEQLRDTMTALRCRNRWRNLIEAIRSSGDGRSPAGRCSRRRPRSRPSSR